MEDIGMESSTSEKNKALVYRWFEEVWGKGRAEAIDEMFAAGAVAHGLADEGGAPLRGPEGFKPFFLKFLEAFPDIEVNIDDIITEGDAVAARCTVRATHKGNSLGIEATQQPVEFTGITMLRVKDGQIAEAWNNFDFLKLFQQIGAV
jgi:steroid delta-isomerase-like uncharacterized protein